MKSLLKFVVYSVAIVLGLVVTNLLFSLFGDWISTKNSFAVALGFTGVGVMLGVWGWLLVTGVKKAVRAFFAYDPSDDAPKAKGDCCQNDCGCDRSR